MALTRKLLTALGIDADKQDQIIDAHVETVDGLKQQIAQFKADADKLPEVQAKLEKAEEAAKHSGDAVKIQKDFDDYKAQVEAEKSKAAKESALRKIAKDAGLTEAGIAKAVKYAAWDTIEVNEKGEAKNASDLMKALKDEWAEYIGSSETKGAEVPKPAPGGKPEDYEAMSDADYYKATYLAEKKKG